VLFLNRVFEKLSGHKPEEFIGKSFAPLFDEENLKKATELYTRTLKGESLKREVCFKDTGVLCEYKNIPLRDNKGEIIGVLGSARDITESKHLENERKNLNKSLEQKVARRTKEWAKANEALQIKIVQLTKAEDLLQKSKEQIQSILDNSTAIIYLKDMNGKYILVNQQFETLFHVNRNEIMGKTDMDIFPGEMAGALRANDRSVIKAGIPLEMEETVLQDDGPNTYISLKFPLFDSSGIPDRICGISTNITKRKRAEEKLFSYQKQLKHISSELSLAEERERRRISEDLHDRIGQALTAIKMKLEELKDPHVGTDSDRVLNETGELLDNAIQATRTLTFEISPPILYELGFEPAMEWLIEQFRERHNIPIDYDGNGNGRVLNDDVSFFLFKSARELMFNVIKHARADRIIVLVRREKNGIRVSIEDDGFGFDFSKIKFSVDDLSGFGLFSIRERMEHFGGNFDVESKPGQGTCITLAMPLEQHKGDRVAK